VESFLVNQLGDRFKHAKLLEVSDGSYLITMDVRLPVFGKALTIEKRDMKRILGDKASYLLKRDEQKYSSKRNRVGLDQNQEVLMSKNTYQRVISLKAVAILNTKGYKEFNTIMIQNETLDLIYAKNGGTVMVESEEPSLVNLIVRNTIFKNMRSSEGSAL
jgi:hypothetical protein